MGDQPKKKMTYKYKRIKPPAGFHFYPTDEQLVEDYLIPKKLTCSLQYNIFPEVQAYSDHPKNIIKRHPSINENTWYFFTKLYRLYPKDSKRPSRKIKNGTGVWKTSGSEESIAVSPEKTRELLQFFPEGVEVFKRKLIFYVSKHPTPWMMDEYVVNLISKNCAEPVDPTYVDHCALCCLRYRNGGRYRGTGKDIVEDEKPEFNHNVGSVASSSGNKDEGEEIVKDKELEYNVANVAITSAIQDKGKEIVEDKEADYNVENVASTSGVEKEPEIPEALFDPMIEDDPNLYF